MHSYKFDEKNERDSLDQKIKVLQVRPIYLSLPKFDLRVEFACALPEDD